VGEFRYRLSCWRICMAMLESTPLQRAETRCSELEAALRKSPDFHLYLMTGVRRDRARMERLLLEIPEFKLWYTLRKTLRQARRAASKVRQPGAGRSSHFGERLAPGDGRAGSRRGRAGSLNAADASTVPDFTELFVAIRTQPYRNNDGKIAL